ncbi:MAG: glycosyltransferase [Rhodobacteraceae bacterium]|nr:glycosyltransferase [Paracoccaceae bacterium]
MTLALVIPVHNDQHNLTRLLQQAAELGIFDQVILSDDGSDMPAHAEGSGLAPDRVTQLRSPHATGAGAARNRALARVTCDHLLFFDSDDLLTSEIALLWQDLQGKDFDFCLFRHHDTRRDPHLSWGQLPLDNALWRQAGAGASVLFAPNQAGVVSLAQTANYPWNKIYRTDFLRAAGLCCSETPVHNDIKLHWLSFLHARHILVSDRVAAIHEVRAHGQRLTNRSGKERLCVFEPLSEVAEALAADTKPDLREAFFHFTANLLDWIRTVLAPEHHPDLDRGTSTFLNRYLEPGVFDRMCRSDPLLALRLTLQMVETKTAC